jgi:hypothetical protein
MRSLAGRRRCFWDAESQHGSGLSSEWAVKALALLLREAGADFWSVAIGISCLIGEDIACDFG